MAVGCGQTIAGGRPLRINFADCDERYHTHKWVNIRARTLHHVLKIFHTRKHWANMPLHNTFRSFPDCHSPCIAQYSPVVKNGGFRPIQPRSSQKSGTRARYVTFSSMKIQYPLPGASGLESLWIPVPPFTMDTSYRWASGSNP